MERILDIVKAPTWSDMDITRCKDIVSDRLRAFHVRSAVLLCYTQADIISIDVQSSKSEFSLVILVYPELLS